MVLGWRWKRRASSRVLEEGWPNCALRGRLGGSFGGLDFGEDAVPEGETGFNGGFGGEGSLFPAGVVVGAEVGHHAEREGAVVFAVDFDMAFEVPDELAEVAGGRGVEVADEVAEDVGDDVFAPEGEGCGSGGEVAGVDDVEGGAHESPGGGGTVDGTGGEDAMGDVGEQRTDGGGVGVGLLHGFEVELEVGDGTAFVEVRLFAEDDLVDEAAAGGEGCRRPGSSGAGKLRLEGLEERHEIPDGEDVRLHEESQVFGRANACVERVVLEASPERRDAGFDGRDAVGGRSRSKDHTFIIALTKGVDFMRWKIWSCADGERLRLLGTRALFIAVKVW